MAKRTAIVMTKGVGKDMEVLNFVSVKQAAGYFHGKEKVAASMLSAQVNITAAANGVQSTGSNKSGVENRHTAYGYVVTRK